MSIHIIARQLFTTVSKNQHLKKLIRDNSLYLGISILSSSATIILIPLYLSYFSVAEYGELALMNATFGFLAILITLSLESAFQTFYFDQPTENVVDYFRSIRSFALLFATLVLGVMTLAGPWLFQITFSNSDISFYPNGLLVLLNVAFTLVNQIYFVLLRNQEKVKRYGKYIAMSTVLTMVLQVVLITIADMGVTGALLGMMLANGTVFFLVWRPSGGFSLNIQWESVKKSLKYSLWLIPFFLINWFLAKGDRLIVERFLGLEEVGIYALLMNIAMVISLITTSVLNSIRPTLFREFKKLTGSLSRAIANIGLYFTGILAITSLAIYLFVRSLDYFSLFAAYTSIKEYIGLGLALFVLRAFFRLFSEYLSFLKRSKDLSFISIMSVALFGFLLWQQSAQLSLDGLLLILVIVNGISLVLIVGRCIIMLKKQPHAS